MSLLHIDRFRTQITAVNEARIAEHYRDAMLEKDKAAMALLERICLFRLGVDALAAIFTGEQAAEVSGQADLNAEQLQSKLD